MRHGIYAWLWLCLCCLPGLSLAETTMPNVLLVVADDLGAGDLRSFYPAARTSTPNLDALAAQGMRFTRFYTDSTCSASRASLLTGQHPARLGFHPVARGISPELVTLPEYFRTLGYSTHLVGKWHIGELDTAARPAAQGFDTFFGFLNQWFLQGPDANGAPTLRPPVYDNPWLETERGDWQPYHGYLPDILTDHAAEKIRAMAGKQQPWLLWYATPLVHGPLHRPPGSDASDDDGKYHEMVSHLDANIGQLLRALDDSGQRSNTVVIVLSDNGAPEKRAGSNAGFSGGKAHYAEASVRTPMIWVDPGYVEPGSMDERAITIADVFPTLAGRVGHPLPFATDGMDFNQLENLFSLQRRALFWMSRGSSSILSASKEWRLTEAWVFREKQSLSLWRIGTTTEENLSGWRYLYAWRIADLRRAFVIWVDNISRTAVQLDSSAGITKVTSNDFLRAPMREWDFYVAVEPAGSGSGKQVLAEQPGIWSLAYVPEQAQLQVEMYGHHWEVPVSLPAGCSLLGLNADVYDRYTNIGDEQYPTELLLSINGQEVQRTQWQIDSLAGVPLQHPTWVGAAAGGDHRWQGKLSKPVFFHRANLVGEWAYFINEAGLKSELCGQLH